MMQIALACSLVLVVACSGQAPAGAKREPGEPQVPTASGSSTAPTNDARARSLVEQLAKQDFAAAVASFDATMKQAIPAEKLAQLWRGIVDQVGPFQRITRSHSVPLDQHEVVHVTCKFEKSSLVVKIAIGGDQQVTALFFAPDTETTTGKTSTTAETAPPPYANRSAFDEQDVEIGQGEWRLMGTVSMPKGAGPHPAVVLVHGSGPHDRDETLGPNKPFRDLAWGLASKGIAVLRYEKRTHVHAAKLAAVRDFTVQHEVIEDALAAVARLREMPAIDDTRVFVAGHSLGGLVAPRILEHDAAIAGMLILAGSTRPLEDLIVEQVKYLAAIDGSTSAAEKASIDAVVAELGKLRDRSFSSKSPPVLGLPASYWIDLKAYDPVATAKAVRRPTLVLQGGRDYQVTLADFDGWKKGLAGRRDCTFQVYENLNHLFMAGTGPATPAEYQTAGHVDVRVIDDSAKWIVAQARAAKPKR